MIYLFVAVVLSCSFDSGGTLPSDIAIAESLLYSPEYSPVVVPEVRASQVETAFRELATSLELFDEREAVVDSECDGALSFECIINRVRARRLELADVPMISEAAKLPSYQAALQARLFNRQCRQCFVNRLRFEADRADLITRAIAETDALYRVWDAIEDAQAPHADIPWRRYALRRLNVALKNIGWQAEGFPPYVPEWHFQDCK